MADDREEPVEATSTPGSWLKPWTWSLSLQFLPIYVGLLSVFIGVYYFHFIDDAGLEMSSYQSCVGTFNYTFRVNAVLQTSKSASKKSGQSWEIANAYDALLQTHSPERHVFSPSYLHKDKAPPLGLRQDEASIWAEGVTKPHGKTLHDGDLNPTISGPASLGVAAILSGQRWMKGHYLKTAARQREILLKEAPRTSTGAISYRNETPELRPEALAMFAPFLAYAGAVDNDLDQMREAFRQCRLYRDALVITAGPKKGLWRDTTESENKSPGDAWSTANAAVAYGLAKVRSTIAGWHKSKSALSPEVEELDSWIAEILDAAIAADDDPSGLLRNYLGDASWPGETTGTSLMAAVAYRMAVLSPVRFASSRYVEWAERKRKVIFSHIGYDGIARPAADPYRPGSRDNVAVSPEGQSYAMFLVTAWRDCVCAGLCLDNYLQESGMHVSNPPSLQDIVSMLTFENLTGVSFESITKYFRGMGAGQTI